jgi:K+ transporter
MNTPSDTNPRRVAGRMALTIGALGVVFGDIGTSPLYTLAQTLGYGFLTRNARLARDYFNIPPSQIIEIGMPVQL